MTAEEIAKDLVSAYLGTESGAGAASGNYPGKSAETADAAKTGQWIGDLYAAVFDRVQLAIKDSTPQRAMARQPRSRDRKRQSVVGVPASAELAAAFSDIPPETLRKILRSAGEARETDDDAAADLREILRSADEAKETDDDAVDDPI